MRVLFVTYPWIGLGQGGLQHQIERTSAAVSRHGVSVLEFNPWKYELHDVDLVHVFGTDPSVFHLVHRAKSVGKPVVVSPVYSCYQRSIFGDKLRTLIARKARVMWSGLRQTQKMLALADRVLALNDVECLAVKKIFHIPNSKLSIVPNGIERDFQNGDAKLFSSKYSVRDFVLHVGSIVPVKNHLKLIRAMETIDAPLVIVGEPTSSNSDYYNACVEAAGPRVLFTGRIEHDDPMLSAAYAAAKVFALPSYSEVMPLVLYEAAAAGCNLVASRNFPIDDDLSNYVSLVNPNRVSSIRRGISKALTLQNSGGQQDVVNRMLDWDDVGARIVDEYEDTVLSSSACMT